MLGTLPIQADELLAHDLFCHPFDDGLQGEGASGDPSAQGATREHPDGSGLKRLLNAVEREVKAVFEDEEGG